MSTHKFAQKAFSSRDIPLSVTHTLKVGSFFPIAIHRINIGLVLSQKGTSGKHVASLDPRKRTQFFITYRSDVECAQLR